MSNCAGCYYSEILDEIRAEFPAFKMVWKEDSRLMQAISWFLWCVTLGRASTFMERYVTIIGCTVYVPYSWRHLPDLQRVITLRHERVHMRQRRQYTMPIFTFLYLFCPLPGGLAYFRAKFEMEAYAETIKATLELFPNGAQLLLRKDIRKQMIENFTGPMYFWMWPFRKSVERWYDRTVTALLAEQKVA